MQRKAIYSFLCLLWMVFGLQLLHANYVELNLEPYANNGLTALETLDQHASLFTSSLGYQPQSTLSGCNGSFVESDTWQDTMYVCITPNGVTGGVFNMISIGASPNPYTYIITDPQGNILGLPPTPTVDFTTAPAGECWVYGLSYEGNLTAMVGQNIHTAQLADSCADLSNNFVVVLREEVDGGTVKTNTHVDTIQLCYSGGRLRFQMDSVNAGSGPYAYIVTDTQGNILGLPPTHMIDFTNAGIGECWVWGVNYTGNLTAAVGDNVLSTSLSDGCFDLSDNFVVALRDSADGGVVQSELGPDTLNICYNDPTATTVYKFDSTMTFGDEFTYLVTNDSGIILGIPPGDMVDFAGAGPGVCYVWGLSYHGTLTAQVGDDIFQANLCTGCFDLSDNFITVIREEVDGGMVQSELGPDTLSVCYNDPTAPTVFKFDSTGASGGNFTYVVTDDQANILGVPPADMVNFAGAGPGICYVWGLSYTGNLTAMVGQNAASVALSDGCFDLSDNFIVVVREDVNGGMVQSELGADTLTVCYNDPTASTVFSFDSTGTAGPNFTYVVTDDQANILGVPPADMVNFAGAGPGICYVWGLSYSGNLTAMIGQNAASVALSDGCFDLSDNFIVVVREEVNGGMVQSELGPDTLSVCYNDPTAPTIFKFDSTGASGGNFTYVVTDDQANILGVPPADMVNFAGAGPGICYVWGLSYTGNLTAMVGQNAASVALSDGCFDLSDNFIVVVREDVNGGMVQSELGADTLTVCYNDPTASTVFSFDSTGTAGPNFTYVVTDDQANILGVPPADMVNFAGAGPGICYVWGLSYSGNLTAMVGQNAASVALSDGCFDLSDNFIVVVREEVNGGMVQSELGPDTLSVCYNDPTAPTVFKFDSTGASGGNFTYVVTDDQANILGVPPADMVNFAGAGPGICYVWGLSYTGNLTAMVGQNAASVALSDGCFDLSDNFIVVVREDVNGGMVQSELGADTLNICYSDPNGVTTFKFDSTGTSGPNFTYVVTDDQANILGVPPADMVNFTGAGPGICYVWGLSYSGNLTAMVGQNAASVALSDGCFDLSDNFVVVVREEIEAGIVKSETNGPDDLYVCYNDPSAPTAFKFDSLGHTSGNFAYVVTDTSGTILGLPPGDMVDFAGAGPGICYVWGLAYTGNITAMAGDNALQTALADGCFDLSDNFIRVIRDSVDAGIVKSEINGPDDLLVCYNDANSTTAFKFDSLGHYGGNYAYVVTDTAGTILGLPPGDMVDFAGAGPGICYVWGLAYTGNITAMAGDNALQIALSDGCFDLSDNFITVVREDVNGGMVQAEAGSDTLLVCYAGGTTAYAFDSTGTTGSNFTYVVTDDNGVILGVPPADMVDFAGAGPGICYVWGLSYTGNLTAMLGDTATNVALSDGCFDLSDNFIVVLRDSTGVPCGMNLQALTQTLVYPVPAQNEIKVEIPGAKLQDDNVLIEIFGMSGQLKYSSKEQAASQQDYRTNIDISSFEKGVFILRVRHGDESIRRKFIKQ